MFAGLHFLHFPHFDRENADNAENADFVKLCPLKRKGSLCTPSVLTHFGTANCAKMQIMQGGTLRI